MADKDKKVNQVNEKDADKDIDKEKTKKDKDIETDKADKKKEKAKKKKEKKEKKKRGTILIPFVIALLLIGVLAGIIEFNPFNIREQYLRSTLDKIPFINAIIPQAETDNTEEKEQQSNVSVIELQNKIDELNAALEQSKKDSQALTEQNDTNMQEIARLQEIENQQIQIKNDKAEFDKMIAEKDPSAYAKFYEKIAPDNAEVLYKEAVVAVEKTKELKKYISDIDAMDDSSAAKALEELILTNMDLVVNIMNNLNTEKCGSVLSAMDTKNAASVIKAMSPS